MTSIIRGKDNNEIGGRLLMSHIKASFRVFKFAFKSFTTTIFTLVLVGSIMLNITLMAWSAGAFAIGTTFTALTGITSVVGNLKNNNDALKKTNKKLEAKQAKVAANRKLVGELSEKIALRTTRNAARNIVSMPAESLPYIGVVTVVTVTGLEIKDACATMEDIKEINRLLATEAHVDVETTCGMEVLDRDAVIASIAKSPQAAYEAVKTKDVAMPAWSDISNGSKKAWANTVEGAANAWDWLLGG